VKGVRRTRSQAQGTTWRPGRERVVAAVRTPRTWSPAPRSRGRADVARRSGEVVPDTRDTPR